MFYIRKLKLRIKEKVEQYNSVQSREHCVNGVNLRILATFDSTKFGQI
jgi:hypothetical protein